jgi:competence ComEA-like helix-hairpin-helix protein
MSRIERAVIIILILLISLSLGLSYYKKILQKPVEVVQVNLAEESELAQNTIEARRIVNINTADAYTLTKLPGIGPAIARRIIEYRQKNLRFNSPQDLLKIKGIDHKKFQSLKDYIRIDD